MVKAVQITVDLIVLILGLFKEPEKKGKEIIGVVVFILINVSLENLILFYTQVSIKIERLHRNILTLIEDFEIGTKGAH